MEGKGFTEAKNLNAGDEVRTADGAAAAVENVETVKVDKPIKVYNFEVEDIHTYYVSQQKVLVHNTCAKTTKNVKLKTNNVTKATTNNNTQKNVATVSQKPYSKSRPTFRKGVVEQVWEDAKDAEGLVHDPNTGEVINWIPGTPRKGVWDMGHIHGEKYSDVHAKYMRGEMSKEEFLEWYNNPANYRPELPSNNRSHRYE